MLNLYGKITKIILELGIKHVIYTQHFRGPDEELFTAGMKHHYLTVSTPGMVWDFGIFVSMVN